MEIKIEKGVPIPEKKKPKYPFDEMETGDSFGVPVHMGYRVRIYLQRHKERTSGKEFITRTVGDEVRVWRTK